ncbi:MFS transporter [Solwaraspora sp. WMMB335]|uniref:MFS transporter n=1 Tax=Solwaraspora sp. WMMB335 TaxID=3404118 RepID=UPI003B957A63
MPSSPRHRALLVGALCFLISVCDGYDLIVFGSAVPELLREPGWGLGPVAIGLLGSCALVGMLVGALTVGAVTDRVGRRRVIIVSLTWFSLAMAGTALAAGPISFGVCRFLAGIGLGGVIPSTVALTVEYAAAGRKQFANAAMFTGYSVGGVLAALIAILVLADHGWRALFWIGTAPLVVVLPLVVAFLPESRQILVARNRRPQHLGRLFGRDLRRATFAFAATSFCGLLLVYGLNTWLPQIMRSAGYGLTSALSFQLALNAGAVLGCLIASALADRFGARPVVIASFGSAALALLVLSARPSAAVLTVAIAVAGLGSIGTQTLVNGYVATYYPPAVQAAALGVSLGVGRAGAIAGPLVGGWISAAHLGTEWNFYCFAVPAVLGAFAITVVPRLRRTDDNVPDPHPAPATV